MLEMASKLGDDFGQTLINELTNVNTNAGGSKSNNCQAKEHTPKSQECVCYSVEAPEKAPVVENGFFSPRSTSDPVWPNLSNGIGNGSGFETDWQQPCLHDAILQTDCFLVGATIEKIS